MVTGPGTALAEVAVIGMACRVPGADGVEALWDLMVAGDAATGPVPSDRTGLAAAAALGGRGSGHGGFLTDVHAFDADHFGISRAEAPYVDVQQRLVLETAWHSLEDAGVPASALAGTRTGVFVGQGTHDHSMLYEGGGVEPSPFVNTGLSHALSANRLSYHLDLRGPSMAVDTACSSSLVAVHLALRSLRQQECDLAIVAGVNVLLSSWPQLGAAALNALSPSGTCHPFDAGADGYVRAEGVGAVVLRRVQDTADDRVRAVVRGSATGQDGRTNGITAPSGRAQTDVVRAALADADTADHELCYVEAHGTGTPLGDPIEARALAAALPGRRPGLLLGSAKGHVGHCEAAAGIVGLIRTVLVLEQHAVPPQAGHSTPHPALDRLGLRVPTTATTLSPSPPVASVSSFGFGGTNAHVVLAAEPRTARGPARRAAPEGAATGGRPLLLVSASTPTGVETLLHRYAAVLDESPARAGEVALAAATCRTHLPWRVGVPAPSVADLPAAVTAARGRAAHKVPPGRSRVGLVFSGHGSQWLGMGRRLLAEEEIVAGAAAECDAVLTGLGAPGVTELVLAHEEADLADVSVVQPVVFALQIGLARCLAAAGIAPHAVVGHSVGEVAAAVTAGSLTLSQGITVVHHRNHAVASTRGTGGMAVLDLEPGDVARLIAAGAPALDVAALNGPRAVVVAGPLDALDALEQLVLAEGGDLRRVHVDYPSHSRLMTGASSGLTRRLAGLVPGTDEVSRFSGTEGGPVTGSPDNRFWGRNLREPVRFAAAVAAMRDAGTTHFVEVSPHPVLLSALHDTLADDQARTRVVPTLTREADGLVDALARLYEAGVDLDPAGTVGSQGSPAVALPRHPFDHSVRYDLRSTPQADHSGQVPPELRTGHRAGGEDRLSATSAAVLALSSALGRACEDVTGSLEGLDLLHPVADTGTVGPARDGQGLVDAAGRTCLRWRRARSDLSAGAAPAAGAAHRPGATGGGQVDLGALVRRSGAARARLRSLDLLMGLRLGHECGSAEAAVAVPTGPGAGPQALEAAVLAGLLTRWATRTVTTEPDDVDAVTSVGSVSILRPMSDWDTTAVRVHVVGAGVPGVEQVEVRDGGGDVVARVRDVVLGAHVAAPDATGATPAGVDRARADREVRRALAEVLPGTATAIGARDDATFAEMGVDSLLAAEIRGRLERRLGMRLSMSLFWRYPTTAQLAGALAVRCEPASAQVCPGSGSAGPEDALGDLLGLLDPSLDPLRSRS